MFNSLGNLKMFLEISVLNGTGAPHVVPNRSDLYRISRGLTGSRNVHDKLEKIELAYLDQG